ncbi:MAG TPA: hypothetical protein ENI33_05215 [Thermoplasmatales archaeon]|nr:hypothetical protein [Thermoplasmatales archaeon]
MAEGKPAGIVVLAILYGLEAIVLLGTGALFFAGGGMLGFGLGGAVLAGAGIIIVLIGLIDLLIAYGLWTLKSWARTMAIIFAIIGLIGFPIGTIISIIILWYLFKPEIKEAFH